MALLPQLHMVCAVITVFFLSFPLYAAWVIYGVTQIEEETRLALDQISINNNLPFIFFGIKISVLIGGLNFVACLFLWLVLWRNLSELRTSVPQL